MIPVQAPDQLFAVFGEPMLPMPGSGGPVPVLPGQLDQPMVPVLPGRHGQQHVLEEPMIPMHAPDGPFSVFGEPMMPMPGTDGSAPVLPGHLGQPMVSVLPGQPVQNQVLGANLMVPGPVSNSPLPGLAEPSPVLHGEMRSQPAMLSAMPSTTLPGYLPQTVSPTYGPELLEVHHIFQDSQIMCMQPTGQVATVLPAEQALAGVPAEAQPLAVPQPVGADAGKPAPVFRHIVRPSEDASLPVQTAVVRPHQDVVLAAHVANEPDSQGHFEVEWEWVRAAHAVGLKSAKRAQVFAKEQRAPPTRAHSCSYPPS